jgi:translation initiation factor 2D
MFKKEPVQERSKSLLKNKDIRAFRQSLLAAFPRLANDKGVDANPLADAPFLDKSQVSTSKLGSHGVLYSCPEGPIAFEPRDGDVPGIVPSLYFLSCYPRALRRVEIHSPVSEYILNGADLMLPGVVSYECKDSLGSQYVFSDI